MYFTPYGPVLKKNFCELNPKNLPLSCCSGTQQEDIISSVIIGTYRVWATKKFPFFEARYRATVILRSVSVPFYNFPCFYCCVSIF